MFVPSLPVLRIRDVVGHGTGDPRRHLPKGGLTFFSRGREALGSAVDALAQGDSPVLFPAYVCASALEPFRRSGRRILFYEIGSDFGVDPGSLASVLEANPRSVVVVVHLFGIPDPRLQRILEIAEEQGAPVVEDCAHALYSRWRGLPLGSFGEAAIFSLRKMLPAPDGGVLVRKSGEGEISLRRTRVLELARLGVNSIENVAGFSLRTRLLASERVRRRLTRADDQIGERAGGMMSQLSYEILRNADGEKIRARRRANYEYVAHLLAAAVPEIAIPWPKLPEDAAPMALPMVIPKGRDALASEMYRRDIAVRALWDVLPREIDTARFPESARLRDTVLCIPVHQDLEQAKLDRVIDVLSSIWRSS